MSWTLDANAEIPLWIPQACPPRALVAATTRRGGVSDPPYDSLNLGRSTDDDPGAVGTNRRRVLERLSLDPARLATAGQVHGADVVEIDGPGFSPRVDALVTRVPGLALAVTTADCLSVLYVTPTAVAAAHSGWRGTAAGLPSRALEAVCSASGTAAGDVLVFIGPGIGPCCYAVGDDVASRFPAAAVTRAGTGARVDLARAAVLQLVSSGVPERNVATSPACTSCARDWCFSHRRDTGRTGRHWGLVALLP